MRALRLSLDNKYTLHSELVIREEFLLQLYVPYVLDLVHGTW